MLSIEAVAKSYDVEISTVRKWIRGGLLPAFRIGRVVRVSEEDEREFRREHTWRRDAVNGARAASTSANPVRGSFPSPSRPKVSDAGARSGSFGKRRPPVAGSSASNVVSIADSSPRKAG